ncbi:MAG: preprotein translocase subunit SecE [Bdellovibrio sp.]|uniref:preprotein translocase subunit SecE n=1 Tax=Bdellovibrio sp. TaxID=28201 RepID=UPI0039E69D1B|nr:preprotein translocase subunit SecE [Bdellovibrio sp.]
MEKANSKILTLSFAIAAILVGLTTSLLIKAFAGAFGVVARAADSDIVRHGFPVVLGFAVFAVLQFNPRVLAWGEEVVTEIRKVVWPSRKDTTAMTIACVIMVLISSVIISSFDLISGFFINYLMK